MSFFSLKAEPVLEPISFPVLVAGNPHVIVCVVKAGDRPITLSWYKNNQLIKQEPDLVVSEYYLLILPLDYDWVGLSSFVCANSNQKCPSLSAGFNQFTRALLIQDLNFWI